MATKPDYKSMGAEPDRDPEEKRFISSGAEKIPIGGNYPTATIIAERRNPAAKSQLKLFPGEEKNK